MLTNTCTGAAAGTESVTVNINCAAPASPSTTLAAVVLTFVTSLSTIVCTWVFAVGDRLMSSGLIPIGAVKPVRVTKNCSGASTKMSSVTVIEPATLPLEIIALAGVASKSAPLVAL